MEKAMKAKLEGIGEARLTHRALAALSNEVWTRTVVLSGSYVAKASSLAAARQL
jgi:hypothetical protein